MQCAKKGEMSCRSAIAPGVQDSECMLGVVGVHLDTAFDAEDLAGDERGSIRTQIGHRVGDLVGPAESAHGMHGLRRFSDFREGF